MPGAFQQSPPVVERNRRRSDARGQMTSRSAPGTGNWTTSVTPAVGALAVVCSATALSGVVSGGLWIFYVLVAVAVVSGTGVLLRATRLPSLVVGLGQIFALLCLLVTIFTRSGVLAVLPGPDSLNDLLSVLGNSITEVQTGVPPVGDSPAMRCLIMLAMGLVAVLVDTLAVGSAAPAASGLVLLCVFAVPASLADEMLPAWTFVLGAGSFALLLVVDGQHRHEAWRGRMSGGGTSGSGRAATAVAGMAVVIALIAGAGFTLIGTVGRLPGTGTEIGGGSGGLGLKAMTSLRGMLNQGGTRELFHVRGLPTRAYLRAMTLQQYDPKSGEWTVGGPLSAGSPAQGDLPPQPGDSGGGQTTRIDIDPVGWLDLWLPTYGRPRKIENTDQNWRFDPARGMVSSVRPRKAEPYTIETVLTTPSADDLRKANGNVEDIDPIYFQADGIQPGVAALARQLTQNESNKFDKASALYRFFTDGTQGFKYTTKTAGDTNADALADFVFNGKTGFCEQYASAMAVMARSVGLPARVALGFTGGVPNPASDFTTISSLDAHAWVEVYFAGQGWMVFDPTPLTDGRGVTPPYIGGLSADGEPVGPGTTATTTPTPTAVSGSSSSSAAAKDTANQAAAAPVEEIQPWHRNTLIALIALGLLLAALLVVVMAFAGSTTAFGAALAARAPWARKVLLPSLVVSWSAVIVLTAALLSWWLAILLLVVGVVASPAVVRAVRRRNRLHSIAGLGAQAANAAWEELVAESVDRGTRIPPTETVRVAARRMARAHNLDEQGRDGLRSVVGAIERSWYSGRPEADPQLPHAVDEVRRSMSRNAPLALRAKVLPRSVLHPSAPAESDD